MNPFAVSTAWAPQHALYGDPRADDRLRRHLEAWEAASCCRYEHRAAAVSRILNSHSDQLNLSRLGLTAIPPMSPDRPWCRVDLSHNSLETLPAEPPAIFTALPPGAQVDLRANPLGPLPAWAEAMAQRGGVLYDPPASADSADQRPGTQPSAARPPSPRADRLHAELLRRAAVHYPNLREEEITAIESAPLQTIFRAERWNLRHGTRLRTLLAACPRTRQETGAHYVRRLHALHPTLDLEALSAMSRCQASNLKSMLRRQAAKSDGQDARMKKPAPGRGFHGGDAGL